jgi:hypothetical protein
MGVSLAETVSLEARQLLKDAGPGSPWSGDHGPRGRGEQTPLRWITFRAANGSFSERRILRASDENATRRLAPGPARGPGGSVTWTCTLCRPTTWPPPRAMCTPTRSPAWDPSRLYGELFNRPREGTAVPGSRVVAHDRRGADENEPIEVKERFNIFGVLGREKPDRIAEWMAAAPGRFIPPSSFRECRSH